MLYPTPAKMPRRACKPYQKRKQPALNYEGEWGRLTKEQQAAARQLAGQQRGARYEQKMLAGAVLKPCPPTREELHSQLISLDRELAALERARRALCQQLDALRHEPLPAPTQPA